MRLLAALREAFAAGERATCFGCRAFVNDPEFVEASLPGLTTFSSGFASVRADDGWCLRHETYLNGRRACAAREAR
ncbi:MAG: hypothetical protein ACLPN5_22345 [Roseiarcus sp.]